MWRMAMAGVFLVLIQAQDPPTIEVGEDRLRSTAQSRMQLVLRPASSAVPKRDRPWNGLLRAGHRGDRIATLSMRVKSRTRYLSSAIEGWRNLAQAGMAGRQWEHSWPRERQGAGWYVSRRRLHRVPRRRP